jgi:hypothetical protein
MPPQKPVYPYVTCSHHRGLHLSYAVCIHVAEQDAPITLFDRATIVSMGAACCKMCEDNDAPVVIDDLRVICAECIKLLAPNLVQ